MKGTIGQQILMGGLGGGGYKTLEGATGIFGQMMEKGAGVKGVDDLTASRKFMAGDRATRSRMFGDVMRGAGMEEFGQAMMKPPELNAMFGLGGGFRTEQDMVSAVGGSMFKYGGIGSRAAGQVKAVQRVVADRQERDQGQQGGGAGYAPVEETAQGTVQEMADAGLVKDVSSDVQDAASRFVIGKEGQRLARKMMSSEASVREDAKNEMIARSARVQGELWGKKGEAPDLQGEVEALASISALGEATGLVKEYGSLDAVPPEVRARYDKKGSPFYKVGGFDGLKQ